MNDPTPFRLLIQRVRAGDDEAAAELVRTYEPQVRREVRIRLTDPALRRIVDSTDITQSVLANFFVRAALGQFDLDDPAKLQGLLVTMARNRVRDWARKLQAERRDQRRVRSLDGDAPEPAGEGPTPSENLSAAELYGECQRRLSTDEREIADGRAAGASWDDLSAKLGVSPDALRMRLARALDRISRELGLEDLIGGRRRTQ